jgi:hypothetical protein
MGLEYFFSNFIWRNPRDWCVMFCLLLSQFINRIFLTVLMYDKSKPRRPTTVVPGWSRSLPFYFILFYLDHAMCLSGLSYILSLFRRVFLTFWHRGFTFKF